MLCLRSTGNGDSVILSDSNSHIPFLGNSDTVFYSKWMVTTDILKIIFQPRPVTVTSERTQLPATTSTSPSPPLPVIANQQPSLPRGPATRPFTHIVTIVTHPAHHLHPPSSIATWPHPSNHYCIRHPALPAQLHARAGACQPLRSYGQRFSPR